MRLPTGANVSDYGPSAGKRLYRVDHLTGGGEKDAQTECGTQSNEHLFIRNEDYLMSAGCLSNAPESVMPEQTAAETFWCLGRFQITRASVTIME
jgi:hypothetical protein